MACVMTDTLSTTFDPAAIEARWYAHWEDNNRFRPERPDAEAFTIVNPPPNVTGSLHIGHALDNTLQDIIVRYERLRRNFTAVFLQHVHVNARHNITGKKGKKEGKKERQSKAQKGIQIQRYIMNDLVDFCQ